MPPPDFKYLIFDVESIADGDLIAKVRYPGESLSPTEAVEKYRQELIVKWGLSLIHI